MSFREKSAWISFVLILLLSLVYFSHAVVVAAHQQGYEPLGHLFFALVGALVVLEIALHVAVAIRAPREASTDKDERDRLIDLKATHIAFPVLLVGALAANLPMHLGGGRWAMSQCIVLAIVIAELVRFGSQIVYYRRDA